MNLYKIPPSCYFTKVRDLFWGKIQLFPRGCSLYLPSAGPVSSFLFDHLLQFSLSLKDAFMYIMRVLLCEAEV